MQNSIDTTVAGIVAALAFFLSDPGTIFPAVIPEVVQEVARFVALGALAVLGRQAMSTGAR